MKREASDKLSTGLLITGATGFLGRHLLGRVAAEHYKIYLLKGPGHAIHNLPPGAEAYYLRDPALTDLFREGKIQLIVHCATNYGRGGVSPLEMLDANLLMPLTLLQMACDHGATAFINSDTILDKRISSYSLSKRHFAEWLALHSKQLVCANVALEHFYGPDDDPSKFTAWVIRELLVGSERLPLTPGQQKRDFIYIEDVVDAFSRILTFAASASKGFYQYEVGTSATTSIRDFVEMAYRLIGAEHTILDFGAVTYRENEVMESHVDTAMLKKLGWAAKVPLEEGLKRTIEAERRRWARG